MYFRAGLIFICLSNIFCKDIFAENISSSNKTLEKVVIKGEGISRSELRIYLKQWEKAYSGSKKLAETIWENDSSFIIIYEMTQPQMAMIVSSFDTYDVLLTPGDNIEVTKLDVRGKPQLYFKGKNSGNYNYFYEASRVARGTIPINKIRGNNDPVSRDSLIQIAYTVLDSFNTSFLQKEKITTHFKDYLESYKYWVIMLRFISSPATEGDSVIPDNFRVPEKYFRNTRFLYSRTFTLAISYYVSSNLLSKKHGDLSNDILERSTAVVMEKFDGLIKEYLLMSLVRVYSRNQDHSWENAFISTTQKAKGTVKDPDYLAEINSWDMHFHKGNKPIPANIQDQTLLVDTLGTQYSLADILSSFRDTVLYIDFWATWCGPCKEEFKFYNENRYLFNRQKLNYKKIYLSIDEENAFRNWKEDIRRYSLEGSHYIIRDFKNSDLSNYLQLDGIPRYIIIDKEGKIKVINAPRPSDFETLFMLLREHST